MPRIFLANKKINVIEYGENCNSDKSFKDFKSDLINYMKNLLRG